VIFWPCYSRSYFGLRVWRCKFQLVSSQSPECWCTEVVSGRNIWITGLIVRAVDGLRVRWDVENHLSDLLVLCTTLFGHQYVSKHEPDVFLADIDLHLLFWSIFCQSVRIVLTRALASTFMVLRSFALPSIFTAQRIQVCQSLDCWVFHHMLPQILGTISLGTGVLTDIVTAATLCFFLNKLRTGYRSCVAFGLHSQLQL